MHDSSSRPAALEGPTLPVWVTGRAHSGRGVKEAFSFFPLQAVISMETQTAVSSGCCKASIPIQEVGVCAAWFYLQ